jgi:hypothetical protein
MSDYIKNNSKRYINQQNCKKCSCHKFQSYNRNNFGKDISLCSIISCKISQICRNNEYKFNQYVNNQQNLYALMRHKPEIFPIIDSVKKINLTPAQQRQYSNMWYRQFGTSQALPVNDDWGGFYLVGSEVPYTN